LPDRHTQTLFGALLAPTNKIRFVRERVDTPDGDFIDLDWTIPGSASAPERLQDSTLSHTAAARWLTELEQQKLSEAAQIPALLLFHGLEGSSRSRYAQSLATHFRAKGWIVVVAHFRGCSGFANRLARAYHSGDSADIGFILQTVHQKAPRARWYAAGVSLGGNALLKYLGEYCAQIDWLSGAAAISAPLDLVAAGNHLSDNRFNREVYSRYFLRSLKPKVLEKARRYPGVIDVVKVNQARDLRDFDHAYTAPMHGFKDAIDYWSQSASKPWLKKITTPTLVLNARNDPFLPEHSLVGPDECSDAITLHQPALGAHVGFVSGSWPGNLNSLA
jgi:predicted alpha/beta-fold hydrolase